MLTPGAYARRGVRHHLALDLGTSTVRVWTPAGGAVVTEPAVIAPAPSGRHVVGHAALELEAAGGAKLIWPVRQGVVDNFFACVHLLRIVSAAAGRPRDDVSPVLVGVPATATLRQKNLLVAAVRRATGGRVATVEEPLAAALACRPNPGCGDVLAVDIGHGRTEVARITDGAVVAAERVDEVDPIDQLPAIADCVRRMGAGPLRSRRRLLITGGGAACPGAATRLAALAGRTVTMPTEPHLATLTGLRLLLTG
ncbi:rod shape-determining protein [Micromonospora sp. NPDC050200]|uniref:rod shape-determining protein n=1 Tax=Micromonospora sp. NPDC050200 TaxID=3155664 RepID=UPI0033C39F3A